MAKKFLYLVAIIIVVIFVGLIALSIWAKELAQVALVPSTEFVEQETLAANAYEDAALWYSKPGMAGTDPARWRPDGSQGSGGSAPEFALFFIHPTSYLNRNNWNAPIGEEEAERVARIYLRGMASAFQSASQIWAPKYRQATMGAFLTDKVEGQQAIDAAYADVREAYRHFENSIAADIPIVLAGHSQGSLHLLRLLREEMAGSDIQNRIIAAYAIGWPISVEHDLPSIGLPACADPAQTGCLLSWSSFAEPADPSEVMATYSRSIGFDGTPRGSSEILCTNPLTGRRGGSAEQKDNLGTLVPNADISDGELVVGAVPARCDERGLLLIGDPPEMGPYALPGNNYHVYDISLFYGNTRSDVIQRARAWPGENGIGDAAP
ncbi:MAG: DUF3089 domain-containing protein [Erythrobacter sp.]